MTGYCDNCGECFPKASSKFCSACGKQKALQSETTGIEFVQKDGISEQNDIGEQETTIPLWNVAEYTGTKPITLYDRVYGIKPHGVGNHVLWGKAFLKNHTEYRRQHKRMNKNYLTVREWFLPGTNDFVDTVLKSPSIRWNKSLKKEIKKYCDEKRKSSSKKDLIKTLEFPNEGLSLRWKTSDIVRHVSTIKKYRRSSKAMKNRLSMDRTQVPLMEITNFELDTSELPSITLGTLPVVPHASIVTSEVEIIAPEVPISVPQIVVVGTSIQHEKPRRTRKPSLKVVEQAS